MSDINTSETETFYATGWYGETSEGDRAIYTGELALQRATTEGMLDADTVAGLREFEALSGNTLYRYRLIEDGPLLPPLTVDEVLGYQDQARGDLGAGSAGDTE